MRIGLVLFGHLRSFRSTHDSYNRFLKTLQQTGNVDVFCHTWDIEESVTASWWKEHKPGDIPPATVNENEIKEKYQPIRFIIEPSRQFDDSGYNVKSAIPIAGILSMLHSQQQAIRLLEQHSEENNVKYDVIIKSRYDLLYEIAPGFSSLLNKSIEENCLYLPTSNPYELLGSFSDVFALGPTALMKDYFSFVTNFREAVSIYHDKGFNRFVPELCMTTYLNAKSIPYQELSDLRIHILRTNGEKFQINSDKNFFYNNPHCFNGKVFTSNREIVAENNIIDKNIFQLVKKYASWADKEANDKVLNHYAWFYTGIRIASKHIMRLAHKARNNRIFESAVMKDFFEEGIRNGKYGQLRKFFLVLVLTFYSGQGLFFLRVWGNQFFKKKL